MIGKLQRVPLREVWKNEAQDFTPWLQENLDVLSEELGLSLQAVEREQAAGSFSVDLLAEDEAGNAVIIECQLEKSNHDHLGKLLTYLTAVEARAAVWLVAAPRPEHIGAIAWLNESTAASFYLVKVEAVRIGESAPAPLLTLIVGPSEEAREAGETKKELADSQILKRRFWTGLLERARPRTTLHSRLSAGPYYSLYTGAGKAGIFYSYIIRKHDGKVELYIDWGEAEENRQILDRFAECKEQIESEFGDALEWYCPETARAKSVGKTIKVGGYRDDEAKWPEVQDAMIDAMIRLERTLKPHIAKLQV